MYAVSNSGAFRQGEIISDFVQYEIKLESIENGEPKEFIQVRHKHVIVVSQDCDLDWDFKERQSPSGKTGKLVPHILFCEVFTAEQVKTAVKKSETLRLISQNNDIRYQFMQNISPGEDGANEGISELVVDFKKFFSVPTPEAYFKVGNGATRRCRLLSPYLEHFASRFYQFQSRIALPLPHESTS